MNLPSELSPPRESIDDLVTLELVEPPSPPKIASTSNTQPIFSYRAKQISKRK